MRTIARTSMPASRSTLRFYTSTVSDNDPEVCLPIRSLYMRGCRCLPSFSSSRSNAT